MKIHKKSAIAIVLAVIVLLIIGSCAAANASEQGCVTKKEWANRGGEISPNTMGARFGAQGTIVNQRLETIPYYMNDDTFRYVTDLSVTKRYAKCGSWGAHKYVKVWYITWWDNQDTKTYSDVNGGETMVKYRAAS